MSVDKTKVAEILALKGIDIPSDFAWGGAVKNVACSLNKFQVDNNEFTTPLTLKDVNALKVTGSFTHTLEFGADRISVPQPQLFAQTSVLLDKLGLDLADLDIKFDQMILCGAEERFPGVAEERNPDKFATMMVQIPVEGGFQGGRLHVYRQHQGKSFDFTSNSHNTLHAAIFYADCKHEMEEIKSGWRLVMVFDLTWKTSLKNFCSSGEMLPLCKKLKKLRSILEPWGQEPKFLALPLKHKCEKSALSFATLEEEDCRLAQVLQSTNQLDIHLAVLRKHRHWACHCNGTNIICCPCHDCEPQKNTMVDSYDMDDFWLGANDKPTYFKKLTINTTSELIGALESIFVHELEQEESEDEDGMQDYFDGRWYSWPVLVFWPKKNSIDMALQFGLDGVFDILERLTENPSTKQEAVDALHQVLAYCKQHPSRLFYFGYSYYKPKYDLRGSRLLKICIHLGAKEESLELLIQLATQFNVEHDEDRFYSAPSSFIAGILGDEVAECIAELVSIYGWEYYSDVVDRLLSRSMAKHQIGQFAHLVYCLLDRQCVEAAVHCGRQVISLIFSSDVDISQQYIKSLQACVSAIFKMEENSATSHLEAAPRFIGKLHSLTVESVCGVIIRIRKSHESLLTTVSKSLELYRKICGHLLVRDFASLGRFDLIGEVLKCLIWLADFDLLQSFANKLINDRNEVIGKIVSSNDMKDAFLFSPEGKRVFEMFVDSQIADLDSKIAEYSTFTWKQPDAVFAPEHPLVEEFLRSSSESFSYCNFTNIIGARNFATRYFYRDSIQKGYSATAQAGGSGKSAYCHIVKTRDIFESRLLLRKSFHEQLASLKELRHQLDFSPESGPSAKRPKPALNEGI